MEWSILTHSGDLNVDILEDLNVDILEGRYYFAYHPKILFFSCKKPVSDHVKTFTRAEKCMLIHMAPPLCHFIPL